MDPMTMQWITLGMAAGSYLLHAWQAYRAAPAGNPVQPAPPVAPLVPGSPAVQPIPPAPPGHITIGHGELIKLLLGFAGSQLGGGIPALPPAPTPPVVPAPAPVVPMQPASPQVDLNGLLQGLLALIQQSKQHPAPVTPAPAPVPVPA